MPKQIRKPKSHRGCTACRASKRKCSEDKPTCKNCVRDGKACQYDIDALFRIQTYDGTQLPNRRMRQIITPLPKVTDRQNLSSPQSLVRSSPAETPLVADLVTKTRVPPPHSLATASLLRKRASLPLTDMKGYQLSHPLSNSEQPIETPPTYALTTAVDPSIFAYFSSPSPHSLSSLPMSLNSYGFTMMDFIDPNQIIATPPMTVLSDDESSLVGFFLREFPSLIPFSKLFPSVSNQIWSIAVTHIPLTHSILAISSYLSDQRAGVPRIHGLIYLEKALTQVQEAISVGTVDEGLIVAVFLFALLNTLSGDFKTSRHHLQEMCELLHFYQQRRTCSIPPSTTPCNSPGYPVVMLLGRIAIRMEYHVAFYDTGHGAPIFPIINASQESQDSEWISQIVDKTIPNGVDWALASFALDKLMNRAGHLSHKLSERCIDSIDHAFQIQELVEEHESWKRRPVVNQAIIESLSSPPDGTINPNLVHTSSRATSLHYTPKCIQNKLFATLSIRHFMAGIYLSLISDPYPGPISPERFQSAINMCRHFVALYGDPPCPDGYPLLRPADNCIALITAFRKENYTHEFGYCLQTLSAIARETGFSTLLDVLDILKVTRRDTSCEAN